MTSIRAACRPDLLIIIAITVGTFGCAGGTGTTSGSGGGGGPIPPSSSQLWSGILDPSRATDWTRAGVVGGIPNRTTICATPAPSGDATGLTDKSLIEGAIASCGANGVVQLTSGTVGNPSLYYVAGLNFGVALTPTSGAPDNVSLRGGGPDKTKLIFTQTTGCGIQADVCIAGSSGNDQNYEGSTSWTAGYSQGTTTITVGSTSGIVAGQLVILDQRDDSIGVCPLVPDGIVDSPCRTAVGITETGPEATVTTSVPHGYSQGECVAVGGAGVSQYNQWWIIDSVPSSTTFTYGTRGCNGNSGALASGLADSGGGQAIVDPGGPIFATTTTPAIIDENGGIGRSCPDSHNLLCGSGEISQRNQFEIHKIVSVNTQTNQVTIDPPLEAANWTASKNPGVWWTGRQALGDGIEALTIDATNDNCTGGVVCGDVVFLNTYGSWETNVRSLPGNRNHVWIKLSSRTDVLHNYFFGTKADGSKSYGVEVTGSDNLIENNICQHVVSCTIAAGSNGNVYAYNYTIDPGYGPGPNQLMAELSSNHDFAAYDLCESNNAPAGHLDNTHGTSMTVTCFRNRFRGQDTPIKTNGLRAFQDAAFNRFANVIGNVLGTSGAETGYQATTYNESGYIYWLAFQGENFQVPNDPIVLSSLLRWGNYDVANGSAQWNSSEVPTSSFPFINGNPVPGSHTLPASFYHTSQPSFWSTPFGTPPWPAIGPDVRGGTAPDGVDGYSYSLPAQLCAANTAIDSSYQQTFPISNATWGQGTYGGQATIIANNTLAQANTVTISGATPSGYNGIWQVLSATSTQVVVLIPANPGTYFSGGTINYPNILNFNAANCFPEAR